jgi:hypothetical protein
MPDPKPDRGQSDGGEEVSRELVVAGGDGSEVFDPVEEAFDEVALSVDLAIDGALDLAVALGGDVRSRTVRDDEIEDGAGVIAAIGDGIVCWAKAVEERLNGSLVGGLTRAQHEPQRQAASVHHDMNFGAQSASRSSDGVIRAPFFPPAACWWARTMEESIR